MKSRGKMIGGIPRNERGPRTFEEKKILRHVAGNIVLTGKTIWGMVWDVMRPREFDRNWFGGRGSQESVGNWIARGRNIVSSSREFLRKWSREWRGMGRWQESDLGCVAGNVLG